MAELSERSRTPVPTIKYYLREGLLPRGEQTSRNQARYGDWHLRRLRLVRALTDVGGLSIATVRDVLAYVDTSEPAAHHMLGRALRDLAPAPKAFDAPDEEDVERMETLVERREWRVHPKEPNAANLAKVLTAYRHAGHPLDDATFDGYVAAAEQVARVDLDTLDDIDAIDEILERAVVHTVLGDTLLAVLRRLAQSNESAHRSGSGPDGG